MAIADGATENNSPGYYLDGSYSTIVTITGAYKFEIKQTLHTPKQNENWVYLNWGQFLDVGETTELTDWYESWTCGVRYNENSLKRVSSNDVYLFGYRGSSLLKNATGKHTALYTAEQQDFPWIPNYARSSVTTNEVEQIGTVTSSLERDFQTKYSSIPLKVGDKLKFHTGYRVYNSVQTFDTEAKGFAENLEITIIDGAINSMAFASLSLAALAASLVM